MRIPGPCLVAALTLAVASCSGSEPTREEINEALGSEAGACVYDSAQADGRGATLELVIDEGAEQEADARDASYIDRLVSDCQAEAADSD